MINNISRYQLFAGDCLPLPVAQDEEDALPVAAAGSTASTACAVVPLPAGVACYAVAGTLGPPPEAGENDTAHANGRSAARRLPGIEWLGDGLVPLASALGRHARPTRDLHIPASHTWTGRGIHHLDLLASKRVYRQLRRWLAN